MATNNQNNPTPEQCDAVADVLEAAHNKGYGLNMHNGDLCGTYLCHGGAYAVMKGCHDHLGDSFLDGADLMSEDLDFKFGRDELKIWAEAYSLIWGNDYGMSMFNDARAFFNPRWRPEGARTIKDIADHWREVGDRIKALNEKEVSNG